MEKGRSLAPRIIEAAISGVPESAASRVISVLLECSGRDKTVRCDTYTLELDANKCQPANLRGWPSPSPTVVLSIEDLVQLLVESAKGSSCGNRVLAGDASPER